MMWEVCEPRRSEGHLFGEMGWTNAPTIPQPLPHSVQWSCWCPTVEQPPDDRPSCPVGGVHTLSGTGSVEGGWGIGHVGAGQCFHSCIGQTTGRCGGCRRTVCGWVGTGRAGDGFGNEGGRCGMCEKSETSGKSEKMRKMSMRTALNSV